MPLTGKQMLQLLKKNGWEERRQEGSIISYIKMGLESLTQFMQTKL
jgi:predicted RNA binding protein YcfA (HicA-like mRNA interferase family)